MQREVAVRCEPWTETAPGALEIDILALCGGSMEGAMVWALDATDIHSGWTEAGAAVAWITRRLQASARKSATRFRPQHHNGRDDANSDQDSDDHEKDDPVALRLQTWLASWLGAPIPRYMAGFRDEFVSGPLTVLQAFPLVEMVGHVSDGIAFFGIIPGNADAASTISLVPGSLSVWRGWYGIYLYQIETHHHKSGEQLQEPCSTLLQQVFHGVMGGA